MNTNCRIGKVTFKKQDNVLTLSVPTSLDVPPSRVLAGAFEANLKGVMVLGYLADGSEYFASSYADGGDCIWLMDRARHKLMQIADLAEA